jgi:hypothetical protein
MPDVNTPDAATLNNNSSAPAPAPVAPAPDSNTVPAPDVNPSAPAVARMTPAILTGPSSQPPQPPKESFGEGFVRASSPQFTTDAQGNVMRAEPARKTSLGGVLGSVLASSLQGALAGMSTPTPEGARSKSAALSIGASGAMRAAEQKKTQAEQIAADNFQRNQQAVKERAQTALANAEAINWAQKAAHDKALLPAEIEKAGLDNKEISARLDIFHQQSDNLKRAQQESAADFLSFLSANDIPYDKITHATADAGGHSSVYAHAATIAPQIASGQVGLIHTGDSGDTENNGVAVLSPDSLKGQPLANDFHYKSYVGADGKPLGMNVDGTPKFEDRVIAVKDQQGKLTGATSYQAYIAARGSQLALAQTQKQLSEGLQNAHVRAQAGQADAAANESNAKAAESRANAAAIGGDVMKNTAQRLVDGFEDPGQMSKRSKTFDATVAAADAYSMATYGKHWDQAQAAIDFSYAKNPNTQNTLNYLNSLTGRDGKSGNLGELITLSNGIDRSQFPAINDVEAWAKLQKGDPAMAQYKTAVTEVSDQVAKILQGGGSGNGTSDAKLKQAQELFNTGFSKESILAIGTTLRDLLGNRKVEMIGNNRYLMRQYGSPQQPATAQPNPAQPAAGGESGPTGFFSQFGGKPVS